MRILLTFLALFPLCIFCEETFSMVKPEAVEKGYTSEIIALYEKSGLHVVKTKEIQLTKEQAEEFYSIHKERPFFDELTTYISSGPVVALLIEGDDAVVRTRELMGATNPANAAPGTIRAKFGTSLAFNAVHGSDSKESAEKEIAFFFKR